jgi:hypothetical protein
VPPSVLLGRLVAAALAAAIVAGNWDIWWHQAVGRESFWIPPHVALYLSVTAAILLGVYGWYLVREKVWRRLGLLLALIPLSAPFDEMWHRIYGVENLSSAWIIWSPPHLVLAGALIGGFVLLLPILHREKEESTRRFFVRLAFASILSVSTFLTIPLQPTDPYRVLGFWGAGITVAVPVGILLAAQSWRLGFAGATQITFFFVPIVLMRSAAGAIAAGVDLPPFASPPYWLATISFILPALSLDLTDRPEWPLWARGALAGTLLGGIYYGVYPLFTEQVFRYGASDALIAVFSSLFGGLASAGVVWAGRVGVGGERVKTGRVLQSHASGRGRRTDR